jgi:hypothetical protein
LAMAKSRSLHVFPSDFVVGGGGSAGMDRKKFGVGDIARFTVALNDSVLRVI